MELPFWKINVEFTNQNFIGKGAFGSVYKGKTASRISHNAPPNTLIAVKRWYENNYKAALKDCTEMYRLDHRNVVETFGIIKTNPPLIVMEYLASGDLLGYIKNRKANGKSMTADQMIKCAYGIACGMKYLHHELKPYKKHEDLAARNCLLGKSWKEVKVADLGCWNDGYENENYYEYDEDLMAIPARWMAPECVPYGNQYRPYFSRKNDVWAFGVVLFEIWTRGELPFGSDRTNEDVCLELKEGNDPLDFCKANIRAHIRNLMYRCWDQDPNSRPNFKSIVDHFEECEEDNLDIEK